MDARPDYRRVAEQVAAATGIEELYEPGQEAAIAELVVELRVDGLTAREAVELALLNNPELRAGFGRIGMSRAEVVQAGLLANPTLGIAVQFPSGGGLAKLEAGVAQNIADLWRIPGRKRIAESELTRAVLDLARDAARLAAETKSAYYAAVGAREKSRTAEENLAIARQLLDQAAFRQEAGETNEIEVNLARGTAWQAEIDAETARLDAAEAARELALLLGLGGAADALALTDPLPDVATFEADVARLVEIAREARLDLRVAREAVVAAEEQIRREYAGIFPEVELGVALERGGRPRSDGGRNLLADTARASISEGKLTAPEIQPRSERRQNTDFVIGPTLDLELPIFDQNQAGVAKAKFAWEQARHAYEALDLAAAREVRGAVDQARSAWKIARLYRERMLPLAESNRELSETAYAHGQAGLLAVLEAQRFFLESRAKYVDALRAAAVAVPELERAVGLPFDELIAEKQAEAAEPVDGGAEENVEP